MDTAEANTELKVVNKGLELVTRWDSAVQRAHRLQQQANSAECDMRNTQIELVTWLVPKDAKIGDTYMLAVGDGFLEVRVEQSEARAVETGERSKEKVYSVGWRGRHRPATLGNFRC